MCEMMSKGLKEDLTVLIITHVTHVERVESAVCGLYKGSKQCMYVWNDVEGVERSLISFNYYSCYSCRKGQSYLDFRPLWHALTYIALDGMVGKSAVCGLYTQYRYIQCYVERVERLCCVEIKDIHILGHNFLNIQVIFNPKKVLESWDLDLSNHTIQYYVCRRGWKLLRLSTPSTCLNGCYVAILSISSRFSYGQIKFEAAHHNGKLRWILKLNTTKIFFLL